MRRSQARPAEELQCDCLGMCMRACTHVYCDRPVADLAYCCIGPAHARGMGTRPWQAETVWHAKACVAVAQVYTSGPCLVVAAMLQHAAVTPPWWLP